MVKGLEATCVRIMERILGLERMELGVGGRPQSNISKGRGFVPLYSRSRAKSRWKPQ